MTANWRERFENAASAFQELKSLTKHVPANQWTPEYRALAEKVHSFGRDHFYVDSEDY